MNTTKGHGNGERGTGRAARVEAREACEHASQIERTAERCGRARARRIEAWEGRIVDAATTEEIVAIYRAEFIAARARCGSVVDISRLFDRQKAGKGVSHWPRCSNPYPFPVRRAWVAAVYRAASAASREVHGAHRVADQTATMADLVTLREWSAGNWGEARGVEVVESTALARESGERNSGARKVSPRQVAHARECLVAHWGLSGSKRWHSTLAADLRLLAQCVKIARGEGSAGLGAWEGAFRHSSQCRAVNRLRERIASGDALLTDDAERAEGALASWRGARPASRAGIRAGLAAERADFMLVS